MHIISEIIIILILCFFHDYKVKKLREEVTTLSNVIDGVMLARGYNKLELKNKIPDVAVWWIKRMYFNKEEIEMLNDAEEILNNDEIEYIRQLITDRNKLDEQANLN